MITPLGISGAVQRKDINVLLGDEMKFCGPSEGTINK